MSFSSLVQRYTFFAVVAMAANLAVQRIVLAAGPGEAGLLPALLCGTAAGLVVKYLLDKRWIFQDSSRGLRSHGRKFALYTVMGVGTTLIFWVTETAFWLIWHSETLRDLGALLGLTIGYTLKYNLDRLFVFAGPRRAEGGTP